MKIILILIFTYKNLKYSLEYSNYKKRNHISFKIININLKINGNQEENYVLLPRTNIMNKIFN